ncbi:MAG: AtpZ/AtpI family protein [Bacteroidia bacterium]|nr:AtpZ/AtpI family protein [Bacteroidia bacterium]
MNNYIKYTQIGFQMAIIITLGAFGGKKLDEYNSFSTPVFTIILSLLSIAVALYLALKDFIYPPKK